MKQRPVLIIAGVLAVLLVFALAWSFVYTPEPLPDCDPATSCGHSISP